MKEFRILKIIDKISFLYKRAGVDYDVFRLILNTKLNISYIKKEDLDAAINIMKESYESDEKHVNPHYQIIAHPDDDEKIGIATICSLSIDGVLVNNGIKSTPKYKLNKVTLQYSILFTFTLYSF